MSKTRSVIILERTEVFKGQKDHLVYMIFLLPDRLTKAVFVLTETGECTMDFEQLEKLNDLKEKGILSQEEFEKEKQKLLNGTPNNEKATAESPASEYADFSHLGIIKGSFAAFFSALKRCIDIKGRTSRFDYFGALFFLSILFGIIKVISIVTSPMIILFAIPIFYLQIILLIRRLHDVNKRGWWMLTLVVPVCTMFFKGDKETNRFGPAPATDEKKANRLIIFGCFLLFLSSLYLNFSLQA